MSAVRIGPDGTPWGCVCGDCGIAMVAPPAPWNKAITLTDALRCPKCGNITRLCDKCGCPGAELADPKTGAYYCAEGSNQACPFGRSPSAAESNCLDAAGA